MKIRSLPLVLMGIAVSFRVSKHRVPRSHITPASSSQSGMSSLRLLALLGGAGPMASICSAYVCISPCRQSLRAGDLLDSTWRTRRCKSQTLPPITMLPNVGLLCKCLEQPPSASKGAQIGSGSLKGRKDPRPQESKNGMTVAIPPEWASRSELQQTIRSLLRIALDAATHYTRLIGLEDIYYQGQAGGLFPRQNFRRSSSRAWCKNLQHVGTRVCFSRRGGQRQDACCVRILEGGCRSRIALSLYITRLTNFLPCQPVSLSHSARSNGMRYIPTLGDAAAGPSRSRQLQYLYLPWPMAEISKLMPTE